MMLCAGCASNPRLPPTVSTQTATVQVPVPVPCVTEAERPVLPDMTAVDFATATIEQKTAALARDAEALDRYATAVDALFIRCIKGGV
jgi:hypothetical protein